MSRVERTVERMDEKDRRETRQRGERRQDAPNAGHTPGKAEGELNDVEEALKQQKE